MVGDKSAFTERPFALRASGPAHSWHRIVATGMPRMTAQQAARCEPRTARGAMPHDRIVRVVRTTRVEAAIRAEHRAEEVLVDAQGAEEDWLHGIWTRRASNRRDSPWASGMSVRATGRRTRRITSNASTAGRTARTLSRNRRRRRLRSTALRIDLRPMT